MQVFRTVGEFLQRLQAILWALGGAVLGVTIIQARTDLSWVSLAFIGLGITLLALPFGYLLAAWVRNQIGSIGLDGTIRTGGKPAEPTSDALDGGMYTERAYMESQINQLVSERDVLADTVQRQAAKLDELTEEDPNAPPAYSRNLRSWFELEPLKRVVDGAENPNVMVAIKVVNPPYMSGPVENCTARLLAVIYERIGLDGDGRLTVKEEELKLIPVYLTWSEQDGGSKRCTFTHDATFEVALADTEAQSAQVQTFRQQPRAEYVLDLTRRATVILEVSTGWRRAEKGFSIELSPLSALIRTISPDEEVTPMQRVRFEVSELWQRKAFERLVTLGR